MGYRYHQVYDTGTTRYGGIPGRLEAHRKEHVKSYIYAVSPSVVCTGPEI